MSRQTKPRVMFMHTIDGKPADYEPGEQISFAAYGPYARRGLRLVASIAEIHKQQKASVAWRKANGFSVHRSEYGYVRVEIPS